jgi:hypothetical protein
VSLSERVFYRPLVWSVATALLGAGALLAIQMISAVVGPFRIAQLGEHDPRGAVALFRDAHQPVGAAVRSPFGHSLVEAGRSVRELTSLRDLDSAKVGALVLSEMRVLRDDEAAGLRNYLAGGGGAVLVGSIGVRDVDGAWLGYATMRNLLGAEVVPLEGDRAQAIVANRRGPIASALAPRQRIGVLQDDVFPGARVADSELRWAGAQTDADAPAAALRREFGRGRLAWIAVGPEFVVGADADQRLLRRVLEAAVAWSSRTPWVEVLPWPGGASFAGVVEPDTGGGGTADALPERVWTREIDAAAQDAGIARLLVSADSRRLGSTEERLADAIGELGRRGAWLATRSEISTWTRQRTGVHASVHRAGPRRIIVEVTNFARSAASQIVLRVFLNEPVLRVEVDATKLLQAAARVQLRPNAEVLDLVLPPLDPRASAAFSLDYEPAPSQDG